jgi:hypothetical protein
MCNQTLVIVRTAVRWQHVVAVLGFQSGICLGGFKKYAMPLEIPNVHNASLHMDQLYRRHELRYLEESNGNCNGMEWKNHCLYN